jgi:hypothetical protein
MNSNGKEVHEVIPEQEIEEPIPEVMIEVLPCKYSNIVKKSDL